MEGKGIIFVKKTELKADTNKLKKKINGQAKTRQIQSVKDTHNHVQRKIQKEF